MPRSYYRELPKSADLNLVNEDIVEGRRVVVTEAGGRIAGRTGVVQGQGATASQVRVLLDGARNYTVLHVRYLRLT
jgi:hypothetical protein